MPAKEVAPTAPVTGLDGAGIPESAGPVRPARGRADSLRLATGVRAVLASGPTAGTSSPPVVPGARWVVRVPCTTRTVTFDAAVAAAPVGVATIRMPPTRAADAIMQTNLDMEPPASRTRAGALARCFPYRRERL